MSKSSILNVFKTVMDENETYRIRYGPNYLDVLKAIRTGDKTTLENVGNLGSDRNGAWYEKFGMRYYLGPGFGVGSEFTRTSRRPYVFITGESMLSDGRGGLFDKYGRAGFLKDTMRK